MFEPKIIRSRAPLRLGLAGGGTDVSPYCDTYGGLVLNATINRYAYAFIRTINEPIIRFVAVDQQLEELFIAAPNLSSTNRLKLHVAVYNHMIENYNAGIPISMELTTYCDSPVGSGLGSSSTMVVAIIRAFVELLKLPFDDYMIANLAFKIERLDCGLQGGRQDQYSAAFGGFNFMEFYDGDRVVVNPLRIKNWIICEFEASVILYYTGVSRESARIIEEQSRNIASHSENALTAMHGIKQEAIGMKESLIRGDFEGVIDSIRSGWLNKKRSAITVSNGLIDEIYEAACDSGAKAGKVSGAGGGGFMWFFVNPEKRMNVIRTLNSFGGDVSNCQFTKHGSQAWNIT